MKSVDFLVGNPHKSENFIKDFKDFMDLWKSEDLWINLRIYLSEEGQKNSKIIPIPHSLKK